MLRSSSRRQVLPTVLGAILLAMAPAAAECPPQDLTVILNTGWDESTGGAVIPAGGTDDGWVVLVDPSLSTSPGDPAPVISPHPAWLTMPNSQWLAANKFGPNGTYVYQYCWCMDDDFTNAGLTFAIRADDQADVYVNATLVLSTPDGTFNDPTPPSVSA